MSNQNTQTIARHSIFSIEAIADRVGVFLLLMLGLSTAGATIMVGL
jgi:hypothetical protein